MKKFLYFFMFTGTLFAEEKGPPSFYPFSISGHYLDVSQTDVQDLGKESLHYAEWDAALSYTYPLSNCWGLVMGAGSVGSVLELKDNPDFHETLFSYINLSLGTYTKAIPCWTWVLTLSFFFDEAVFSLTDYTLYQGVLMGTYDYSPCFDLNVGLVTEFGLKKEKVWPILGFVYKPFSYWRLFVVYPVKIALEYDIRRNLQLAGSIRFLRSRHRLKELEPNSQGIFEYQATGAEIDLSYIPCRRAMAKGYVGYTFGGDLKIFDRNYKNVTPLKFDGSFYAGVSAVLSY